MAGTISITSNKTLNRDASGRAIAKELIIAWVGDADDGSVPALPVTGFAGWKLDQLVVNPGTPSPTDEYNVTLVDTDAGDLAAGALLDLSDTDSKTVIITSRPHISSEGFSVTIADQAVHAAEGLIKLFLSR